MNPFATLTSKLITAGVLLVILTSTVAWFASHERGIGAASVQAKWDAANAVQGRIAVEAADKARATEQQQSTGFASIATGYLQATTHAYPSLSSDLPAALVAGTVQLRNDCPVAVGGGMPETAARARIADAAATQALADRVDAAIAAVRAGDAADTRERQLGAQVVALQAILRAERVNP